MSKNSVAGCYAYNKVLQEIGALEGYKAIIEKSETWADDDIAEARAILNSEKEEIVFQSEYNTTVTSGIAVIIASLGLVSKGSIVDIEFDVAILIAFIALFLVMLRRCIFNKSKVVPLSKQISALDDIITRRKGENYAKNL